MERQRVAVPALLLAGALFFAIWVSRFYPLQHWLFWRYAGYWLACAVWSTACLAVGHLLVARLRPRALPVLEHLVLSFAAGAVAFYLAMALLGHLSLLHPVVFVLLPAAFLVAGGRELFPYLRRYVRHLRARRGPARQRSLLSMAAIVFGLLGLAMVYFAILTPENTQFDARWKHLALAEQYAHVGGIHRFGEGWTVATNPHLVSVLFTWAFLLPVGGLFDRVELAAHMEFTAFLWSLAGIPALVRRLLPGTRMAGTWAARFLFPGVFLYDSSLSAGADHVAAMFVIPVFLALLRAWPDLAPRSMALLAILLAGASMPKLTAAMMIVPVVGGAVLARMMMLLRGPPAGSRANVWRGPLTAVGVGLLCTTPFWLANLIWYGDPLYPSLHALLRPHPWNPDADTLFEYGYKQFQFWRPDRSLLGVLETLWMSLVGFSFYPHDYARYHGKSPTFGSLYTLLLFTLPFLGRRKRIWALVACIHGAIAIWYWTHHQDRYLQTLVPWMAAVTAAILILIWRQGVAARGAAALLVGLQVVWGGDIYFLPNHAMAGSPIKASVDLLGQGYKHNYEERFDVFTSWVKAGRAIPENARVLLHDNHVHLGLARATVSDWNGWQFGLDYGRLGSPGAVDDALAGLGADYVLWQRDVSKGWDSLAGDLVFFQYATRYTTDRKTVGNLIIGKRPASRPPGSFGGPVLVLSCGATYAPGLYEIADLVVPVFGPDRERYPAPREALGDVGAQAARAEAVAVAPGCSLDLPAQARASFERVASRLAVHDRSGGKWTLYVRRGER